MTGLEPQKLESIKAIHKHMPYSKLVEARRAYHSLKDIEDEEQFAVALLYWVGVAEGKRMERARRRRVTA